MKNIIKKITLATAIVASSSLCLSAFNPSQKVDAQTKREQRIQQMMDNIKQTQKFREATLNLKTEDLLNKQAIEFQTRMERMLQDSVNSKLEEIKQAQETSFKKLDEKTNQIESDTKTIIEENKKSSTTSCVSPTFGSVLSNSPSITNFSKTQLQEIKNHCTQAANLASGKCQDFNDNTKKTIQAIDDLKQNVNSIKTTADQIKTSQNIVEKTFTKISTRLDNLSQEIIDTKNKLSNAQSELVSCDLNRVQLKAASNYATQYAEYSILKTLKYIASNDNINYKEITENELQEIIQKAVNKNLEDFGKDKLEEMKAETSTSTFNKKENSKDQDDDGISELNPKTPVNSQK